MRQFQPLFTLFMSAIFGVLSLWAQPAPTRPPSTVEYFEYVFTSMGDPLRPAEELKHRRQMFVERLRLDAFEIAALDDAVAAFRSSLDLLRQLSLAVLRNNHPSASMDATDEALLNAAAAAHRERIAEIGNRLVQAVRPATARNLSLAIERKPY